MGRKRIKRHGRICQASGDSFQLSHEEFVLQKVQRGEEISYKEKLVLSKVFYYRGTLEKSETRQLHKSQISPTPKEKSPNGVQEELVPIRVFGHTIFVPKHIADEYEL